MRQPNNTIILSRDDVQEIVTHHGIDNIMDLLIENLSQAIENIKDEDIFVPIRSGFNYSEPNVGLLEWMPLLNRKDGNKAVIKIVGYHPENPSKYNLPTILSTISSYNILNGHLECIVDGVFLTALRTGAASAIASKLLANPSSKVIGLIGAGTQAITQLHAISREFDLEQVLFYDVDQHTNDSFVDRCSILNLKAEIIPSDIQTIVEQSDIICTATSIDVGGGPLFQSLTPKPHVHFNAVGSDFPGKFELPLDLLIQSFVCPDFKEQAMKEGECQQLSTEQIGESLAEVVKKPADFTKYQVQKTVFDSTGWAFEDQVVMELFVDCAQKLGLGQMVSIENIPVDAKNPYEFLATVKGNDLLTQIQQLDAIPFANNPSKNGTISNQQEN